ncbi:MAG TPA: cyclic nucleotide-binding domain-containing protein, partial [Nevskiaceae bacterium]|nr:cyclic nucleotide-binding domain-containing protein [Nevskiaceae bacterium]
MNPDLLEAFASSPLLRGLGAAELESLASHCTLLSFDSGAILLAQGQLNDRLLVLVDGTADLVREFATHDETIARLSRGALVGEMSTLTGRPVSLTIRATSPVRAASLGKEAAMHLLEANPRLGTNLAMILIGHLQGHLGRRVARTSLLVLDDEAGDAEIEAARALVGAAGRYAHRTITADLTDRLRLSRARGLPTLAE